MEGFNWHMTIFAVTGVTVWPYWCVNDFVHGRTTTAVIMTVLTVITFPIWVIILRRARRYRMTRLEPSLGFSPGDHVILPWPKGTLLKEDADGNLPERRAKLVERMIGIPITCFWDSYSDGSACKESWWAIEDDTGRRVRALQFEMKHVPVLDQLAAIE
jgi:hypothetical protein